MSAGGDDEKYRQREIGKGYRFWCLRRRKEVFAIGRRKLGTGCDLPDCDDSVLFLEVVADTYRLIQPISLAEHHLRRLVEARAPWMRKRQIRRIVQGAAGSDRLSNLNIGRSLGLTADEREEWGIRTIAAGNLTPEEAQQRALDRRRARDRSRAQERR